jgi:alkylation response protein AidB-like acyl-CoA dehydrogenase
MIEDDVCRFPPDAGKGKEPLHGAGDRSPEALHEDILLPSPEGEPIAGRDEAADRAQRGTGVPAPHLTPCSLFASAQAGDEVYFLNGEELAKYADDAAYLVFNNYGLVNFAMLGTEELKDEWLPRMNSGEKIVLMGATEAEAGSDLGAVQTRATYDESDGRWYIDGVKRFATNGSADVQLVLARSETGSSDARGLSLFVVERDETVHVRRIENKLGIHARPAAAAT